jgi:hypothetical protein
METAASIDQVRHMKLITDTVTVPGSLSAAAFRISELASAVDQG